MSNFEMKMIDEIDEIEEHMDFFDMILNGTDYERSPIFP